MAGYDPNQPRDEEGQWTIAGNAARSAAGLNKSEDDLIKDEKFAQKQIKAFQSLLEAQSEQNPDREAINKYRQGMQAAELELAKAQHALKLFRIEKARTEAGLSKGQMQGWEKVRIRKEYGGGSGFIYELTKDGLYARIHKKADGQGEFLGYFHLSSLRR